MQRSILKWTLFSFGKKQLSCSVVCGIFLAKGLRLNLRLSGGFFPTEPPRKPLGFFVCLFLFFFSLLVLIGVQWYFTVVLICNFLMKYDFLVFLICLFTICFLWPGVHIYTSLMRLFVPKFLVLFEYKHLSDTYFVNVFLCLWLVFRFSE